MVDACRAVWRVAACGSGDDEESTEVASVEAAPTTDAATTTSGDRACGAVRTGTEGIGVPLTFARIDGWWHSESIGLCYVILDFGPDVCDLL